MTEGKYTYSTETYTEGVMTSIWEGDALFLDINGPGQEEKAERITRALNSHDDLVASAEAALAYDEAIQACADDPDKMASYCTAEGDDLDALYMAWITMSRAALTKAGTDNG